MQIKIAIIQHRRANFLEKQFRECASRAGYLRSPESLVLFSEMEMMSNPAGSAKMLSAMLGLSSARNFYIVP